jgi:hypothetical protein
LNIVFDNVRAEQEPNYLTKIGNHFMIWCSQTLYKIQNYLDFQKSSGGGQCLIFLLLAQHIKWSNGQKMHPALRGICKTQVFKYG